MTGPVQADPDLDRAVAPSGQGDRPRRRWRFLLTPGWLAAIALAVLFATACFTVLAPWQFSRDAERSAQNDAVTAAVSAAPIADLELPTNITEAVDRDLRNGEMVVFGAEGRCKCLASYARKYQACR